MPKEWQEWKIGSDAKVTLRESLEKMFNVCARVAYVKILLA